MSAAPVTLTPDLVDVLARVQLQLGDAIDALDRDGGRYAREIVARADSPQTYGPRRPTSLHPALGVLVRELVADELAMRRRR